MHNGFANHMPMGHRNDDCRLVAFSERTFSLRICENGGGQIWTVGQSMRMLQFRESNILGRYDILLSGLDHHGRLTHGSNILMVCCAVCI